MTLCVLDLRTTELNKDNLRAAFAVYAESRSAASIRRCWSTWNTLCTFLYTASPVPRSPGWGSPYRARSPMSATRGRDRPGRRTSGSRRRRFGTRPHPRITARFLYAAIEYVLYASRLELLLCGGQEVIVQISRFVIEFLPVTFLVVLVDHWLLGSGCGGSDAQGVGGLAQATVVGNQRGQWCSGCGGLSSGQVYRVE